MWQKVICRNNNGHLEYTIGEKLLNSKIRMAHIKWPDGFIEYDKKIIHKIIHTIGVKDFYTVQSTKLVIISDCHGIEIEMELEQLSIDDETIVMKPQHVINKRKK